MRKGRIFLLGGLWTVTLTLFVLAASGAAGQETPVTMTGEETDYRFVTENSQEGETEEKTRIIRVEECLSEQKLADLLAELLKGYLDSVRVLVETDKMTLWGDLVADDETLIERCPELEPYRLVLRLAQGTEVKVSAQITWDETSGFSVVPESASLAGVDLKPEEVEPLVSRFKGALNAPPGVTITRWKLLPGGLYRSTEEQIEVGEEAQGKEG